MRQVLCVATLTFCLACMTLIAQETPATPSEPDKSGSEAVSLYDKRELTDLANRMLDRDPFVADEAQRDLKEIGAPAVPVLIEMLADQRPEMRYKACEVLAELRDARTVDALIELLKSRDVIHGMSIASVAAKALGRLANSKAIPHLLPLVDSVDCDLRYYTIRALGFLGAKESIPKLIARLKDSSPTFFDAFVRCAAADALGRLKAKEAVPELAALLEDSTEEIYTGLSVNFFATRALERITGESFGPLTGTKEVKASTINGWQDWWKKKKAEEEKKSEKPQELKPPEKEPDKEPANEPK